MDIEIIFKDLESIIAELKEELSNQDSKINEYIKQMIDFFHINEDINTTNLKIIIKNKKYEIIVKSIKFFFDILTKKIIFSKKYWFI